MSSPGKWSSVPFTVKWTFLLWLCLGLAGMLSGIYSIAILDRSDESAPIGLVFASVGLQVAISALICVASWTYLRRAAWGRLVLEIATWLTLGFYTVFGGSWIISAVLNWGEFKASVQDEVVSIDPGWKFTIGMLVFLAVIVLSAGVLKALRSTMARAYTGSTVPR